MRKDSILAGALLSGMVLMTQPGCVTGRQRPEKLTPPAAGPVAAASQRPPRVEEFPTHPARPVAKPASAPIVKSAEPASRSHSMSDIKSPAAAVMAPLDIAAQPSLKMPSSKPVQDLPATENRADRPVSPVQLVSAEEPMPAPVLPPHPLEEETLELPVAEATSSVMSARAMTLEDLERLAIQNNPAILQAAASAHKASALRMQVGRYPNPTVGYQGMQLADEQTDQHVAFISQDIVLGKKLQLSERVLDQQIQVQLWETEAQRYRVLTDVRLKFYEALAAQQRLELANRFHQVAEEGVESTRILLEAQEGTLADVLQSEVQLNDVDLIRRRAEFEYEAAWNELVALIGVSYLEPLPLQGELRQGQQEYDWDSVYAELAAVSPQIRAACSRVARATANVDRQRVQPIPNLNLQFGAGYDNATNSEMMNVQVGLPVPFFNKNEGNISAAEAEYCRAAQDLQRLRLALRQRLAQVAREYKSALVTVERYEAEILPRVEKTLDLLEQAREAGEYSFVQVLVARGMYFRSNLEYNQVLRELAQAEAKIEGMLLTGGLESTPDTTFDADGLRGQSLSGQ